ncbi:MAG: HAD family hydrolase [Salinirussus sp.]
MAVSFDLFGTLVAAERPAEPWTAVARVLGERGVTVPDDWETAYRVSHRPVERGAEQSLVEHTRAALSSRGVDADADTVHDALLEAFDSPVTARDGASAAIRAAGRTGPVGILSNCSVPGLVDRALDRAALPAVDAVVTSVGCGWRKPHDRAFAAVADRLGVDTGRLIHVGDDPRADGGGRTAGVTVLLTGEVPLTELPNHLEGSA